MPHTHTRRHFLQSAAAFASVNALASLGLQSAYAQSVSDYKALVCVFLYGGNDGNNTIIGADSAGYGAYNAVRGAASGINIAQNELLQFQPRGSSRVFGFHPSLDRIHPLFASGQLAVLANVGPLNQPLTKAQYQSAVDVPYQLFSHADQQAQWQSADSRELTPYGWGGRIADSIASRNAGAMLPTITSFAGTHKFNQGVDTTPLALPATGSFLLSGSTATDSITVARKQALMSLLGQSADNLLVTETANGLANAINLSGVVNPILTGSNATVAPFFTGNTTGIATQLQQVAKMIAARDTFGVKRQMFFVSLGGFDTHANQLATQATLLTQLDDALASFYQATVALGVANQVTTFTQSDFGRTFKAAAGGGSDHAWGNHQLILGGAVKGGTLYGSWPDMVLNGNQDVGEGRWLPTTSVDQYAATLASWFGVGATDLTRVVPNINSFSTKDLGFL